MDLKPDEGKVVDYKGQKVGVYKNKEGKILAVLPNCTFEGCLINWNSKEKAWICPCCGSKYSIEGKVLQGPAKEDLKQVSGVSL
jgi:Rieske Fe-S protein